MKRQPINVGIVKLNLPRLSDFDRSAESLHVDVVVVEQEGQDESVAEGTVVVLLRHHP
jgi:hypothetical protein